VNLYGNGPDSSLKVDIPDLDLSSPSTPGGAQPAATPQSGGEANQGVLN